METDVLPGPSEPTWMDMPGGSQSPTMSGTTVDEICFIEMMPSEPADGGTIETICTGSGRRAVRQRGACARSDAGGGAPHLV
eukprot:117929-Prymnesium_polylepis.1